MLILIPNCVNVHAYSSRDYLFEVELPSLCMCAPHQCDAIAALNSEAAQILEGC